MNDLIHRALSTANVPSVLEPTGLSLEDGSRPDGMTLMPWASGKPLVWDFTCRDTLAASHLPSTSSAAGAAAARGEQEKHRKYAHLQPTYSFVPISAETLGPWGKEGLAVLLLLGKRLQAATGEPRSTSFLLQRLSAAIVRGNAASVLSCLPRTRDLEEVLRL